MLSFTFTKLRVKRWRVNREFVNLKRSQSEAKCNESWFVIDMTTLRFGGPPCDWVPQTISCLEWPATIHWNKSQASKWTVLLIRFQAIDFFFHPFPVRTIRQWSVAWCPICQTSICSDLTSLSLTTSRFTNDSNGSALAVRCLLGSLQPLSHSWPASVLTDNWILG